MTPATRRGTARRDISGLRYCEIFWTSECRSLSLNSALSPSARQRCSRPNKYHLRNGNKDSEADPRHWPRALKANFIRSGGTSRLTRTASLIPKWFIPSTPVHEEQADAMELLVPPELRELLRKVRSISAGTLTYCHGPTPIQTIARAV